ncbi:MAG: hypothetical protein IKQ94_02295 [Bacteroidales bacterium]|nr:hypothetical protein [Bacteroidales bacterium]
MAIENKKKNNPLGIAGFVLSIILANPITFFILGDFGKSDNNSVLRVFLLFLFVPVIMCFYSLRNSNNVFAKIGLIISGAAIMFVMSLMVSHWK